MKLVQNGFFHTPDSWPELEEWIGRHGSEDQIHLFTAAGMAWNLAVKLQDEPEPGDKTPRTADGHPVYPGMKVYVMSPFSIEKLHEATIYCVLSGETKNVPYWCVLEENRYFDGEHWDDGNTESINWVFADEQACRDAVAKREAKED